MNRIKGLIENHPQKTCFCFQGHWNNSIHRSSDHRIITAMFPHCLYCMIPLSEQGQVSFWSNMDAVSSGIFLRSVHDDLMYSVDWRLPLRASKSYQLSAESSPVRVLVLNSKGMLMSLNVIDTACIDSEIKRVWSHWTCTWTNDMDVYLMSRAVEHFLRLY